MADAVKMKRCAIPGLGAALRRRREALGWSQEDMELEARERGLRLLRCKISVHELDKVTPSVRTLMTFGALLNCTIDELVREAEVKP